MKTKVETGVMQLQVKDPRIASYHQKLKREGRILPASSDGAWP